MKKGDGEDIEVNRRKTDRVLFESSLLQNISDGIDFLRDETTVIFRELDSSEFKQKMDEINLEEFSENTVNKIDNIFDEISQLKDVIMESDDIPDGIKDFSNNTRAYLNRDIIYVKKARRKLEVSDSYYSSNRAIELCDKAITVNKFNAGAYFYKGKALVNLKKYNRAIEEFINVLALDSECVDARLGIANANRLIKEYDDALDVYNSILRHDSQCFEAIKGKALVYADMGQYKRACDLFKMADTLETLNDESRDIWDLCLEKLD